VTVFDKILAVTFVANGLLAPATAIAAAVLGGLGHRPSFSWVVVGAACSALTFVITAAANVPLNHGLNAALTTTSAQYDEARLAFEATRNRWNLARTLTSFGALAFLAGANAG